MILFFPNAEGKTLGISSSHVVKIDRWGDEKCIVHLEGHSEMVILGASADYVANEINRASD